MDRTRLYIASLTIQQFGEFTIVFWQSCNPYILTGVELLDALEKAGEVSKLTGPELAEMLSEVEDLLSAHSKNAEVNDSILRQSEKLYREIEASSTLIGYAIGMNQILEMSNHIKDTVEKQVRRLKSHSASIQLERKRRFNLPLSEQNSLPSV